ncbi:MAG: tRNA lysidine(34) synthetase TilS [Acidobacteria bacterium]|nr:tRNA lysidine(34) synthetase TilS [Acidobacteriota bacterium]
MHTHRRSALAQQVWQTITRDGLLRAGDRVAVAVSGGADSVGLLFLLEEIASKLGIRLLVCHFNHQLRGAASDADEEFVAGLAVSLGRDFLIASENVAGRAEQEGWNLEDAARRLRYGFFSRLVKEDRADRVAVAHSADDQAETVLAHLLRGTGPTGLGGIYPQLACVVRPLLGVRRRELREYLQARGQDWREDLSNLDHSRLRARIRHRLLPVLESEFHPAIVENLGRLAELAREEGQFWSQLLEDRVGALVERTPAGLSIRAADLLEPFQVETSGGFRVVDCPQLAITRRLIRRLLREVRGAQQQFAFRHIEQVIHLAHSSQSGRCLELPGGVIVERVLDNLVFSRPEIRWSSAGRRETEGFVGTYQYEVELGAGEVTCVSVPEISRRFRLKVVDWPLSASDTKASVSAATLDADRVRLPLVLRNWRPGDCYRPVGGRRVRKVNRLLLEGRVAVRERAGWPVLMSGSSLVWVRGLPVAAEFAPQEGTRAGLVILEEKL